MNWDDLRLLLDVSRHPRLADVSKRTGQDPTTISRRLRRLETDLGLELFERTPKGHVLTPVGQSVADKVESLEHTASEIAALSDRDGPLAAGRVRQGRGGGRTPRKQPKPSRPTWDHGQTGTTPDLRALATLSKIMFP